GHGGTIDGFLFEGKPLDPDTGFYDFGQRFYDPKTSIFLGIDDKFRSDTGSVVGRRAALALMAFSGNNPLRFVDPDGRDFWSPFRWTGRFIRGGATAVYDMGAGAVHMVAHPIDTGAAIGHAAIHPIDTVTGVGKAVYHSVATCIGE